MSEAARDVMVKLGQHLDGQRDINLNDYRADVETLSNEIIRLYDAMERLMRVGELQKQALDLMKADRNAWRERAEKLRAVLSDVGVETYPEPGECYEAPDA